MKSGTFITTIAAATAILATPALAQHLLGGLRPDNLNSVMGDSVLGAANAELGVVSAVDPYSGTITITGRHGEVAQISSALAGRDGQILRVPSLTAGTLKFASDENLATAGAIVGAPSVVVIEPSQG